MNKIEETIKKVFVNRISNQQFKIKTLMEVFYLYVKNITYNEKRKIYDRIIDSISIKLYNKK